MQACIHNGGLCDGLGHSLCWQGNVLVYNSQGPGSREHIAGGHPPCQLGTVPVQWSYTLPIQGEPGPHGPSLIQTLDLLELNLPPSKPSSRQDRLVVELEKKVKRNFAKISQSRREPLLGIGMLMMQRL